MNQRRKPYTMAIPWTSCSNGMEASQFMKKIPMLFRLILAICCAFAGPKAFGANITWGGTGTDLTTATNWVGGVLPSPAAGDMAIFDGVVSGALDLGYNSGLGGAYNDTVSLVWQLTANQTSPVTIRPSSSSGADTAYLVIGSINVAAGAGPLTFGGTNSAKRLDLIARPTGAVHDWVNNSTNPVTFTPNILWGAAGGGAWTAQFSGSGDWQVNNPLVNNNGGDNLIVVNGPGAVYWNPVGYLGVNSIGSPISINGGKLVLQSSHPRLNNQQIGIGTLFEVAAPGKSITLNAQITGPGELRLTDGTLTLSGTTSDYGGGTTLNGGVLIVNATQIVDGTGPLGGGGVYGSPLVTFNGGTLKYSVNNTYDYSGYFNTAANQKYSIDTAGQNVTFTNTAGLTSSGGTLTKLGAGRLTLAAPSTYSGLTAIGNGKLVFKASKSGTGGIIVSNGAALGITDTGTQVTPSTLTVGTSSSATLEFYNINSTATAPLAVGSISAGNTITVSVISGSFAAGLSYPLFSWSSGPAPSVTLGTLNGALGTLTTNGNTIQLNVASAADVWTGNASGAWDTATANNWKYGVNPTVFANGDAVLFDDSASGTIVVLPSGVLLPLSVAFYNNTLAYTVTNTAGNNIGGTTTLTKSGGSTVVLTGGGNTYTGSTTIGEGVLSVSTLANGGVASDIGQSSSASTNLVLDGGTLRYTGGAVTSDRSFTVGTANGTIDGSGTDVLNLTATSLGYSGMGARTLILAGNGTNNLAANVEDSGGATALTKSGTGKWVITGTNTYSGLTTIVNGLLQIGAGGASGILGGGDIANSGVLGFNRTGTLIVGGAISGSGALRKDGSGTVILAGNSSYTGLTTVNNGTLQIGNGGATGSLAGTAAITNNALVVFNSTSDIIINQFGSGITGPGNVIIGGSGLVDISSSQSTYTGWTLINSGATFRPLAENHGYMFSSVITNNGTLLFTAQEGAPAARGYTNNIVGTGRVLKENNNQNAGWIVLSGTNTYTGGTFIAGGGIQIGDGLRPGSGSIVGPVIFTNSITAYDNDRRVIFNRPDDFTFTNDIISVVNSGNTGNWGAVEQISTNHTVILTGNNSYSGETAVTGGILQVGNGGTTGTIGSGNVRIVDQLVSFFQFNRSDNVTLSNVITGAGSFVKLGAGALTLPATSTYTGTTVVSNGTLFVNGGNAAAYTFVFDAALGGSGTLAGQVTLMNAASKLVPGPSASTIGTLTINNSLTFAGNVAVKVNKSLAQSNDLVVASSVVNSGSGVVTVTNIGPALAVGDKFTLFSQPVSGGSTLTVTGGGATWTNNLAVDGSITVLSVTPVGAPTLNFTKSGSTLQFNWTGSGYKLQSQTNNLSMGLGTNWVDYPGGGTSPVSVPINTTNGAAFFRLAPTP